MNVCIEILPPIILQSLLFEQPSRLVSYHPFLPIDITMAHSIPKIDVHHHIVPDFYAAAVGKAGGDPSGWPTPSWDLASAGSIMNKLPIQTAILSSAALARRLNLYAAKIRDDNPARFGFFASLPDIALNVEGALEEIRFTLDELKADGITLFTRYGAGYQYLGDPEFEPIWAELDRREAVVFIHPTHGVDTHLVNPQLLQPALDYPHETARTVADLITTNRRAQFPNCKVILSHAGGTLAWLIHRLSLVNEPEKVELLKGLFRSFHFDLALSSEPGMINYLVALVGDEQVLFGSDFPYAPTSGIERFAELLDGWDAEMERRERVYHGNALKLFPRLAKEWEMAREAAERAL
ncbi:2-amino-3-carboxymuconate-6-semialdehyde decarboxylase [Ephemerocybe angulata]|uniref:6-methylsalicylate decarboxylase n=1 Tax=Ephemerocybe angulata TaxID=980116 RepID=A0A8H6IDY3_9AGAR|nr:2-amino-3-carboxymuconate-6-semialdehyde decarboxylase [Tulosesus angulatus]